MFTIIIAAKDSEKWIPQTVKSLQAQSFEDWECIISINGSKDSTEQFSKSIDDSRFKIIVSEIPNKSLAINRSIPLVKGDWICILDADDVWEPFKLQKQMNAICHYDVDIIGTQLSYIDELNERIPNAPTLPSTHEECVSWLKSGNNPIANSSVAYKSNLHDRVGYYDPEKFAVEDYDMWMRSMRMGMKFMNIDEKLLLHRIHASSHFNSSNRQAFTKKLVDDVNQFYARLPS